MTVADNFIAVDVERAIAVQPLGAEVLAAPDAEHANHLYVYDVAPVQTPRLAVTVLPTLAVPTTLAAVRTSGAETVGVGVGVGVGVAVAVGVGVGVAVTAVPLKAMVANAEIVALPPLI